MGHNDRTKAGTENSKSGLTVPQNKTDLVLSNMQAFPPKHNCQPTSHDGKKVCGHRVDNARKDFSIKINIIVEKKNSTPGKQLRLEGNK